MKKWAHASNRNKLINATQIIALKWKHISINVSGQKQKGKLVPIHKCGNMEKKGWSCKNYTQQDDRNRATKKKDTSQWNVNCLLVKYNISRSTQVYDQTSPCTALNRQRGLESVSIFVLHVLLFVVLGFGRPVVLLLDVFTFVLGSGHIGQIVLVGW